ncbi:MAG: hypothetical protein JWR25_878 [Noviherbaspirillum sp.]|jgi:hypothetical protein|nr:hypothetical protein [Noviherbaspirillum sp.]MDB5794499.1 hypothetical protein [Noviherbaspirillum sp.]
MGVNIRMNRSPDSVSGLNTCAIRTGAWPQLYAAELVRAVPDCKTDNQMR